MESECNRLTGIIHNKAQSHPNGKFLVAIAGAPGSGKTTLAREVVRRLNDSYIQNSTPLSPSMTPSASPGQSEGSLIISDRTHPRAVLVSMDGFHLPRATLDSLPNRTEAYVRRGAPWTFDLSLFLGFMKSLRAWADRSITRTSEDNREREGRIFAPTFSHELKDPIPRGQLIPCSSDIIVVEGNYLLLDEPGWRDIAHMVDLRVFIDADPAVTRDRVARRHVSTGIEKTPEAAYARVDGNDAINASLILEKRLQADVTVTSVNDDLCQGLG